MIFQVVDETFSLVGSMMFSAVSEPVRLVRIMAALLGIAFIGLLVGNSVSLAGDACPPFPNICLLASLGPNGVFSCYNAQRGSATLFLPLSITERLFFQA